MNNEKYEPIKFETWQELAKFVIDGGEVYFNEETKISFDVDESLFNFVFTDHLRNNLYIKKQPTLEELIAIKPRLCWCVYAGRKFIKLITGYDDGEFISDNGIRYDNAQMLTDDEIEQFLSDGDDK